MIDPLFWTPFNAHGFEYPPKGQLWYCNWDMFFFFNGIRFTLFIFFDFLSYFCFRIQIYFQYGRFYTTFSENIVGITFMLINLVAYYAYLSLIPKSFCGHLWLNLENSPLTIFPARKLHWVPGFPSRHVWWWYHGSIISPTPMNPLLLLWIPDEIT